MSRLLLCLPFGFAQCMMTLAATCCWAQAPAATSPAAPADSAGLVAVLKSDAAHEQKLRACQRLALVAGKQSVPVLAELLADGRLAHPARIALEQIPDATAAEALRNVIPRVKGPLLAGVLNSIGVRRDPAAVATVAPLLVDADPQVACAAATALGRIATPQAAQSLASRLTSAQDALRVAVGDACLRCAESLAAAGNAPAARELYDQVRKAALPEHIQAAATRGAILARGPVGEGLLAEVLQAAQPALFAMALTLGRELPDPAVTPVLLAQLPKLAPDRKAALITVLGDRRDPAARAAVVDALKGSPPNVRTAAAAALATLGDASTLDILLELTGDAHAETAAAARESLVALAGPGIDAALSERIAENPGRNLAVVEVVGRRQVAAAVPELLKLADAADDQLRYAAILALGRTLPLPQLPLLVDRLVSSTVAEETAAVQAALGAAFLRMSDKAACTQMLVQRLSKAAQPKKVLIYELLGTIGGPEALNALATGAMDPDENLQDAATRILGDWPTVDAAGVLLQVAQKAPQERFRVRALRGYLRIVRQMDLPDRQRLEMCKQALAMAERDDERVLALDGLGRIPAVAALNMVLPHLRTAKLNSAACAAAVSISEKLGPTHIAQAAEPMRQVLQATQDAHLLRRANEVLQRAEAATPAKR